MGCEWGLMNEGCPVDNVEGVLFAESGVSIGSAAITGKMVFANQTSSTAWIKTLIQNAVQRHRDLRQTKFALSFGVVVICANQ